MVPGQPPKPCAFGTLGADGALLRKAEFTSGPPGSPPPAFLHDFFLTKSWAVCVDHSLRADPTKLTTTGYFSWRCE